MRFPRLLSALLISSLFVPLMAQAITFPDVPSTHPYATEINGLVEKGVISGNPDGTFRPSDPVNRAAMLKMLYLAAGTSAAAPSTVCFPDVPKGSWYESYVCDAAAKSYVKGYTDGTFKPSRPVSRAEAIKMIFAVMGLTMEAASASVPYGDVATSAWYAPYVSSALARAVLPLRSHASDTTLSPDEPIDRAEAAALIWNGMQAMTESASSVSSQAASAGSSAASSVGQTSSRKQVNVDDTGASAQVLTMTFPFTDMQQFKSKAPFSYRFHLDKTLVAEFTAQVRDGKPGGVTCTLFRLEHDGFSTEYYIGYVENNACYLRNALTAGDYQLQLSPTLPDTPYTVSSKVAQGDNNDGFSEAVEIPYGKARTEYVESNDLQDWYKFTVRQERQMRFGLTSADNLSCIIMPSSDVDLFGFEGPACNANYTYPIGTYYVGIGHGNPKALRQTYTVELK